MGEPAPGFWYRLAVSVALPVSTLLTRRDWHGREHVPAEGGVVVCPNHISYADPVTAGHFLVACGRAPRFLAKASLFGLPFVGRVLRGAGQIPVHRNTRDASLALRDAVAAVRRGECVVVYPESTITRDPQGWPMVGKTGAARLALATGAPVVPLAQWGAQEIVPPGTARLRLWPRRLVQVRAGRPVRLEDLARREHTPDLLAEATERIMAAITAELAVLRRQQPPAQRFDLRGDGRRSA